MNQFENEDLVEAFEQIMVIFSVDIKPYAVGICRHLHQQYTRCIQKSREYEKGGGNDNEGSYVTALASFTSMRRVVEVIKGDSNLLRELASVMQDCLMHSLTEEGIGSIDEGIDCIIKILYYGYKDMPISDHLWELFKQLLYITVGNSLDQNAAFGFEYLNQISVAIKNFISRDPDGMMKTIR